MTYRSFSADLEAIAKEWAAEAITKGDWEDLGPFAKTESQPIKVKHVPGGIIGVGKPCKRDDNVCHAAHEKIVADLAYHVGLPIPPVILWDRQDDTLPQRYACISAWAFPDALHWGQVEGSLTEAQKESTRPIFSAMLPFETWVSAEDRKREHTLVHVDRSGGAPALAFIDYSFSLSKGWKEEKSKLLAAQQFLPVNRADDHILQVIEIIGKILPETIDMIVDRIPEQYLDSLKKDVIKSNLKDRAGRIQAMLGL